MHSEESFLHIFFILIRILFILIPLLDEKTYDKKKSHEPNMIQKKYYLFWMQYCIYFFKCRNILFIMNVILCIRSGWSAEKNYDEPNRIWKNSDEARRKNKTITARIKPETKKLTILRKKFWRSEELIKKTKS